MVAEGKICFKTCYAQARIPASHLVSMAQALYSPNAGPQTLHDAIHHWLLVEILTAIGNHSIV
jgi:hypothetical protein